MGVTAVTQEFISSVSASKLFKGLAVDSHNLLPQLAPDSLQSYDIVEGDGGAGTIKHLKFTVTVYSNNNNEVKVEASGEGSVAKFTSHYHAKDGADIDELVKSGEKKTGGFFKLVEAHLLANPSVYA
ncbi:LOW QUALITY PROTEIN: hypothetical protein Tsubulata_027763 [Turnera subulata]|uniref:Bet v I/Major latex protein domain-containing protein n=1 Tax=Turnera subulata TaxID=218843 RepID=A0A9Q0JQJ0_9ROSI|nr:LOW QUALITY PROTEIN: hypothetical protein Tsubulata_027763 [Turnera subulata]